MNLAQTVLLYILVNISKKEHVEVWAQENVFIAHMSD